MSRKDNSPERELYAVAHELLHFVNEEKHEGTGDSRRRGYARRIADLSQQFETLLWLLVPESDHATWRAYLRGGERPAPIPVQPPPLLFKGRDEGGAVMEIRALDHGDEVTIDGTIEHGHPSPVDSGAARRLGGRVFREIFDAPEPALAALRDFLTVPRSHPPVEWARTLLLDGVIDANFNLSERGQRLWRRRATLKRRSGPLELR